MNTVTRWEMDERQAEPARSVGDEEEMGFIEWMPLVDISQDEKEWCLKADLPDVKMEDVSVTVVNGVLSLTGKRKFEKIERGREYYCMECASGTFARSFRLPEGADGSRAAAEHKGGVLTVRVPKIKR